MKGNGERGIGDAPSDVERGLMEEVTSRHHPGQAPRRPAPPAQRSASGGFRFVRGAALDARTLLSRVHASLPARVAYLAPGFSAPARDRLVVSRVPGAPLWYQYLQVASSMNEWWITSGVVLILPRGVRRLRVHLPPELQPLDHAGAPLPLTFPTLNREQLGKTFPSERRSRTGLRIPGTHGVIVVGTRFTRGHGYRGPLPRRTDRDIVETFLHEGAAHAGRFSRNERAGHGDATVDRLTADVERLFPNGATSPTTRALPTAPRAPVP